MNMPVPPLNPLHVFAVAARTGNLTRASEVLGVSQSAVSRQVAVLEGYIGTLLFRRERHGITLTPQGEALQREIAPAFERILSATERIRKGTRATPLHLRVYSTFAVKWLLPRLHRFEAAHPGIGVRLSHIVAPVDFRREPVDMAIQLGDGRWSGLQARRLMPDILQPVCSPRLLESDPPLRVPDDLRRHRLLVSRYRRDDWKDWLEGIGRPDLLRDGLEFTSSVLTYQATAEGLGVAIGQMRLMEQDLASGTLLPLFDTPIERSIAYYVVWSKDLPLDQRGRAFLSWVTDEAKG